MWTWTDHRPVRGERDDQRPAHRPHVVAVDHTHVGESSSSKKQAGGQYALIADLSSGPEAFSIRAPRPSGSQAQAILDLSRVVGTSGFSRAAGK